MTYRMDITFKADLSSGEAYITNQMREKVMSLDPLMRADLLQDIVGMARELYHEARDDLEDHWDEIRRNSALSKPEQNMVEA